MSNKHMLGFWTTKCTYSMAWAYLAQKQGQLALQEAAAAARRAGAQERPLPLPARRPRPARRRPARLGPRRAQLPLNTGLILSCPTHSKCQWPRVQDQQLPSLATLILQPIMRSLGKSVKKRKGCTAWLTYPFQLSCEVGS